MNFLVPNAIHKIYSTIKTDGIRLDRDLDVVRRFDFFIFLSPSFYHTRQGTCMLTLQAHHHMASGLPKQIFNWSQSPIYQSLVVLLIATI